jgi:hypothetical protein
VSELIRSDAATLAARIAAGEVSSTEVTRACLDQIAATDGRYQAFLHVAADQALDTAARVDASIAAGEQPASPLTGVPLALKDVFTTTDMPTTCGSKILAGWRSPYDATLTARLRAARRDERRERSQRRGEEGGRRAGTENVPAIVGGGVAAEIALKELPARSAHTAALQKRLWDGLKTQIPYIQLNGPVPGPGRICTNLNLSTEFIEGEGQLLLCDMNGIAVASGSSCVSKSLKISHVLGAIGLDHALAQGNIIMSLGKDNTEADIDYTVETFAKIVTKLRGMSPMWDEFQKGIIDSVIAPTGRGKSFSQHAADVSGKAAH